MSDPEVEEIDQADDEVSSIEEGKLLDYITDEPVKDTPKEQVRQRIARALFHEYGISVEDMVPDFKMQVDGRSKKIDIAIFEPGADKTPANLQLVVICDKEPKTSSRGVYKMRDHKRAEKEFGLLYDVMSQEEARDCRWGLWTNGLDMFFFEKEPTRFEPVFHPRGDWPMADGTLGGRTVASAAQLRRADDRDMLLTALRRCHPVFMAVAEKVGFDRRGNTLYKRGPDGEELVEEVEHRERVRVGGQSVVRMLRRREKTLDDDLPRIAEAYRVFRAENAVPGA